MSRGTMRTEATLCHPSRRGFVLSTLDRGGMVRCRGKTASVERVSEVTGSVSSDTSDQRLTRAA
jgi:hypothetical protein